MKKQNQKIWAVLILAIVISFTSGLSLFGKNWSQHDNNDTTKVEKDSIFKFTETDFHQYLWEQDEQPTPNKIDDEDFNTKKDVIEGITRPQWDGASNNSGKIWRSGIVGIGTSAPTSLLHIVLPDNGVLNAIKFEGLRSSESTHAIRLELNAPNSPANANKRNFHIINANPGNGADYNRLIFRASGNDNYINIMTLTHEGNVGISRNLDIVGNVGIGTDDTKGYKLAIAGKMIAEEVVVKLQTAWPDYVFTKDYNLQSLSDVESFILTHGHLPEMPSAKEVENNGISIGEMNALLLKKIEELTLYMIELKKENVELREMILNVKQ